MKRCFDGVVAGLALLLLLPLFLLITLWILSDSKGGVIYRQKRVGRYNKDFMLYKFRSMRTGADKQGLLTVGGRDQRITRSGYYLRKYKLDELPQLLNVLKGEMSLVGPRPEVRRYVELYTPEQLQVLKVRPGITDPASITYRNENILLTEAEDPEKYYIEQIMPDKLRINLLYIAKASLWSDLNIIYVTICSLW